MMFLQLLLQVQLPGHHLHDNLVLVTLLCIFHLTHDGFWSVCPGQIDEGLFWLLPYSMSFVACVPCLVQIVSNAR
jgi:hypothetical protein